MAVSKTTSMAIVRITLVCSLFIPTVFLLDNSDGDLLSSAIPTHIDIGLSDWLDVKCTFSLTNDSSMAGLMSLILSRGGNVTDETFTELATINSFASHSVNVLTTERITATGQLGVDGESYLTIQWEYPTEEQAGEYKCTAYGMDSLGHIITLDDVTQVTAIQASDEDCRDKNERLRKYMQIKMSELEKSTKRLHAIITGQFEDPLVYKNHLYYVSKEPFANIVISTATCQVFGGWLVEIDDAEEYKAIQNFLLKSRGFDFLVIGGTDEEDEGMWLLPSTNEPLPIIDWSPRNRDGGDEQNCLMLNAYIRVWQMWDTSCEAHYFHSDMRYMCEIPNFK